MYVTADVIPTLHTYKKSAALCHVTTVEHGAGVYDSISHVHIPASLKHSETHTLHHYLANSTCDFQPHMYMEGVIPIAQP
jgi:hypothetical protein